MVKNWPYAFNDATPLTLGQEFSGYVVQLDNAYDRIGVCIKWAL